MNGGLRYLNAIAVVSFTNSTAAGLATAINVWVSANAEQRTFVRLEYLHDGTNFVAFLSYTE